MMNKAFEKILERLEATRYIAQDDSVAELIRTRIWNKALHKVKQIVKEVAEEYNGGWIPCSERLPQESEPVDTLCEVVNVMLKNGIVTSGWCNGYLEKWYVLDHYHDYPLPYEYKDVIAWQPLPEPYEERD